MARPTTMPSAAPATRLMIVPVTVTSVCCARMRQVAPASIRTAEGAGRMKAGTANSRTPTSQSTKASTSPANDSIRNAARMRILALDLAAEGIDIGDELGRVGDVERARLWQVDRLLVHDMAGAAAEHDHAVGEEHCLVQLMGDQH